MNEQEAQQHLINQHIDMIMRHVQQLKILLPIEQSHDGSELVKVERATLALLDKYVRPQPASQEPGA